MARRIRSPRIELPSERAKLKVHRKPYSFTNLAPGIALGYRRTKGAGSWVLRVHSHGQPWTAKIGVADDLEAADGEHVLNYAQAIEQARVTARGQAGRPATVEVALDDYEADLRARGGDLTNASRVRRHLPPALLGKPVVLLTAAELKRWRNDLISSGLKPATVVRVLKAARAVFNMAADHDPARINNRNAWKVGLAGLTDTYQPVNRVLPDTDVLRLVEAAHALDQAFGRFVEVLATCGCRTSQATRLTVADLQADRANPRLLVPSSRKGRHRSISRVPVPITAGLAAQLERAVAGRPPDAPLLIRADGSAWDSTTNELNNLFVRIAKQCGLSGHSAYSLRHSFITRGLLRGLPLTLVCSMADTSPAIATRVYARFISHAGDDVARRGLLEPVPEGPTVVPLSGRR
jgi:integrase